MSMLGEHEKAVTVVNALRRDTELREVLWDVVELAVKERPEELGWVRRLRGQRRLEPEV